MISLSAKEFFRGRAIYLKEQGSMGKLRLSPILQWPNSISTLCTMLCRVLDLRLSQY